MYSEDIAIRVNKLSKRYEIYDTPRDRLKQFVVPRIRKMAGKTPKQYFREFWALKDVSFEIKKGETFGIIGRNGSGKSTLLQILAGTLSPTSGEVNCRGRIAALLELGSGFNPDFTGRDNVYLNGQILGLSTEEIEARYERIVAFADIGDFIDQPVKTYSSGMFVRLAFAVQAHIDANIVMIDEALAVGDVFFRQKCYARLEHLRSTGASIMLVSHSMPDIEQYCERAILLDGGRQVFIGPSSEAAKHYYLLHQATKHSFPSKIVSPASATRTVPVNDPIDRPKAEAFLDISGKRQIHNGQARCTGVALCDAKGEACNSFRQGDMAHFYYEFEILEEIEVAICGIVISNDRGAIVYGKHSWQFDVDMPFCLGPGSRVTCTQQVKLDLGLGEYVFEVGLASMPAAQWKNRDRISHEESSAHITRICHIANVGSFSIGLAVRNGVSVLTHHGIANLPGTLKLAVIPADAALANRDRLKENAEFR